MLNTNMRQNTRDQNFVADLCIKTRMRANKKFPGFKMAERGNRPQESGNRKTIENRGCRNGRSRREKALQWDEEPEEEQSTKFLLTLSDLLGLTKFSAFRPRGDLSKEDGMVSLVYPTKL